jgi:hypothetical protein
MAIRAVATTILTATCLVISPGTRATTFEATFQASGFSSLFNGLPPPQDRVSGSIVFDAATFGSPIDRIGSVSLVIGGHAYLPGEVGGVPVGTGYFFGGLLSGINNATDGTDDFFVYLVPSLEQFVYTTPSAFDAWGTKAVTFSIAPIPEPTVSLLFLIGLATVAAFRRYRC